MCSFIFNSYQKKVKQALQGTSNAGPSSQTTSYHEAKLAKILSLILFTAIICSAFKSSGIWLVSKVRSDLYVSSNLDSLSCIFPSFSSNFASFFSCAARWFSLADSFLSVAIYWCLSSTSMRSSLDLA